MHDALEARVRAERIEARLQQDTRVKTLFVASQNSGLACDRSPRMLHWDSTRARRSRRLGERQWKAWAVSKIASCFARCNAATKPVFEHQDFLRY